MHERGVVTYVDAQSKTHDALVRNINPMHPGRLTLVYLGDDGEPLVVYDIAHKDDASRANLREVLVNGPAPNRGETVIDGNPDLPQFDHNCWMERDETHSPLPADHPAFDHPFKQPEFDQSGNRIPIVRTEYERAVEEHQKEMAAQGQEQAKPSADDLDKDAEEKAAKDATAGKKVKTWPTAKNGKS
jgi:hypothetical protein